jgi:serine phosphatase RsbU (regulator of sigma subunit)
MLRAFLSLPARIGLTVFLGILFAALCFRFEWFDLVDLKIYDLGLNVRPRTGSQSDVVVVAIDRYSRENCFQPPYFPVSSHILQHSRIIDRLSDAGAKVIAFDILFDQLDPELDLQPFVSALGTSGNVILAGVIESQSLQVTGTGASIQEERVILPVPAIPRSSYQVGLVNVPVGPDHVARQSDYGREFQGEWYPSLPAAVALALREEKVPQLTAGQTFYIDYSSPQGGLETIPYAQVLNREDWQDQVEGRAVMVGVTENGLSDTHKSPVADLPGATRRNRLPGVFFLAYAAETLLKNNVVRPPSVYLSFLLGVFLIGACSFLALGKRHVFNLVLMMSLTVVVLICGVVLTALSITILPTGKLIAATLLTAAMGTFVNLSHTKLKSFQQESQLEEISSDLKMAKQIQQKLQPERIPAIEEVDISGFQIPCKEIGGDYYDVLQLSDKKVAVLVADVSGKGISGALVMSNFQSVVHSLAPKILSPGKLLGELNTAVSKIVTPGRFVTFFYGILDLDSREFTYGNAGHNYPMLCRANGQVEELKEGGLFLGPFPQGNWEDYRIQLGTGDILLLYTDGVTEAEIRKTGEQYGEERLKRFLSENRAQAAEQTHKGLVRALEDFTGSRLFDDDVTILTMKLV